MHREFKECTLRLKQARDRLLRLHKILLDWEREFFENEHGPVSAGRFLEMLLSEERFEWLRVLSTLIVSIDEAFDLDDGLSIEMLGGFQKEIRDVFDTDSGEYADFKMNFERALPRLLDTGVLRDEILALVD